MPRLPAPLLPPLLLLLLLLCSSPLSARDAGHGSWPASKLIRLDQLLPQASGRAPVASDSRVTRAARTAVQYFNYLQGSPSSQRAPGYVKKASVKTIPGVGRKYFLQFSTKDIQSGKNLGTCLATVFYLKKKPKPFVEMQCLLNKEKEQRLHDDFGLYLSIRDSNEPPLEHLWALASIGSSYIAWERSTEDFGYNMAQIKSMKQWRRADDALEFDYTVLLDSDASEPLSCHMRVIWHLEKPLKVKYDCSVEEGSSESADGSGTELGSASGFFMETESNF
ncbi:retinoic acid receptor responder protein 1 [Varanus komodoensis]|uniref:Retinoic acid receptor responder 1 n=1 Tax=Varanus komodoensis TaxID=61221 RepID=A0A8D2KUT8_VARKO|nr:retinoic acid receptor responder protein 1 [Varanus komodoensis]